MHQEDSEKNLQERYNTTRHVNTSKELSFRTKKDSAITHRQSVKIDRAWHGKKIEKQAKVVQQDQLEP